MKFCDFGEQKGSGFVTAIALSIFFFWKENYSFISVHIF